MTRATGLVSGLILGVLIAFIFRLVIRLIPDEWLVNEFYRALLYAAQVPAALLFVPIASGAARFQNESPRHVLLWTCCLGFRWARPWLLALALRSRRRCSRRGCHTALVGVRVGRGSCAARDARRGARCGVARRHCQALDRFAARGGSLGRTHPGRSEPEPRPT